MKLVALTFLAIVGIASADQAVCTQDCMETYIEAVYSDPKNANKYVDDYQECVYSCQGFGAVAALSTCSSCVSTYQYCVSNSPYNWQSCLSSYNSCLGGCNWSKVESKVAEPKTMQADLAPCVGCVNTYETCVTNDPYDWQQCLNTYNGCLGSCSWQNKQPVALATCTQCVNTYQACVKKYPSKQQSCANNYYICLGNCSR
ncbi:hypothetical protein FGO68_gene7171 [Halteria grandinella]|uniref:Uncharacterized protein n=1 Tax=Halteria grandinella TaxID=5974 RepID=A0A8J8SZ69_HALGN|nr:hypothetical protein FGO68_gene7171 [Halteria grandinella]